MGDARPAFLIISNELAHHLAALEQVMRPAGWVGDRCSVGVDAEIAIE